MRLGNKPVVEFIEVVREDEPVAGTNWNCCPVVPILNAGEGGTTGRCGCHSSVCVDISLSSGFEASLISGVGISLSSGFGVSGSMVIAETDLESYVGDGGRGEALIEEDAYDETEARFSLEVRILSLSASLPSSG